MFKIGLIHNSLSNGYGRGIRTALGTQAGSCSVAGHSDWYFPEIFSITLGKHVKYLDNDLEAIFLKKGSQGKWLCRLVMA